MQFDLRPAGLSGTLVERSIESKLNKMMFRKQEEVRLIQQVKPGVSTSESWLVDSATSGEIQVVPQQNKANTGASVSKMDPSQREQQRRREKRRKYRDKKKRLRLKRTYQRVK